jgi:hypothetical protein
MGMLAGDAQQRGNCDRGQERKMSKRAHTLDSTIATQVAVCESLVVHTTAANNSRHPLGTRNLDMRHGPDRHYYQTITVALIRLAGPIRSQFEEADLQAILEELPGVRAIEFPYHDGIEVTYDPNLVGERLFYQAVRCAGFVPAGFGIR